MKLFLTGERDAGKTHIVDRALARWQAAGRGPVLGFRSFKEEGPDGAVLIRLAAADGRGPVHTVARFSQGERALFPEVFDEAGVALLAGIGENSEGIVSMDELGFIESAAPAFQAQVLRVLALPLPVLGVLRAQALPFLDALRARPDLTVLEVTVDTRARAAARCFELLELGAADADG